MTDKIVLSAFDIFKYANLQMAAEAVFNSDVNKNANVVPGAVYSGDLSVDYLKAGNRHASRFTAMQAEEFSKEWTVVEHKANTATGFSGTLFKNAAGEMVMSFRSTEFMDDAARDNLASNTLEINGYGWALGQIADMEDWYQSIKKNIDKPLTVTGYSLGGHLATAFNLMHMNDKHNGHAVIEKVVTFNGAGVGAMYGETAVNGANLREMVGEFNSLRKQQQYFSDASAWNSVLAAESFAKLDAEIRKIVQLDSADFSVTDSWVKSYKELYEGNYKDTPVGWDYIKLMESYDRVKSIAVEAIRVRNLSAGSAGSGGAPSTPADIPLRNIEAVNLGYQLAYLTVAKKYEIESASYAHGISAMLGERFYGADQPLYNQFDVQGVETSGPAEFMVSNSQYRYGAPVGIFIEDQPLLRGDAPWESAKASWKYSEMKLLVNNYNMNDFGDNHSLVLIIDSLKVQTTILSLFSVDERNSAQAYLNRALLQASHKQSITAINDGDGQGLAEGDVLENIVNGLAQYCFGLVLPEDLLKGNSNGNTWADIRPQGAVKGEYTDREDLHKLLKDIVNSDQYKAMEGKVELGFFITAENARSDFGAFIALLTLSPIALMFGQGNPVGGVWDNIYSLWQADQATIRSGLASSLNFSNEFVRDRAKFLARKNWFNEKNYAPDQLNTKHNDNAYSYSSNDSVHPYVTESELYFDQQSDYLISQGAGTPSDKKQYYFGSEKADVRSASNNDDHLYGMGGGDVLNGGGGADHIEGGSGNDALDGGAGNDSMLGGVGADFMLGDSGADTMRGGAGEDRLLGGGQNDALYGDAGNDDIQGGEQNDWLEGGEGIDALDGGDGNDHLRGDGDGDILNGGDGVDALEGGDGEDMLTGGKGDDLLIGGKDRDTYLLVKGDGADIVLDEDGDGVLLVDNKALDGGAQIEEMPNVWLSADRETRYVWEPDNKGIGALMIFRKGNHVVIPNFQNGKFGIKLQGSTSLYLNQLDGGAVVNEWPLVNSTGVQAEFGNKSNVVLSPFGDDEIVTGEDADHFTLGLGLDLVNAGEGNDVFNLYFDHDNSGKHDTVQFSNGQDEEKNKQVGWKWELHKDNVYAHLDGYMTFFARISQDEGGLLELAYHTPTFSELWNKRIDEARKQSSEVMDSQILHGGGGDDLVQGDFGNDALFGDDGNDLLNGSLGNDFLSGGVGSDSLIGGNGRDVLLGGVGGDTLWGEWGEDSLRGGKDNDRLYGDAEYQTQEARFYGNDVLDGEDGDDTLVGGGGDDTLNGGDNADLMFGDFGTMVPSKFEGNDSLVGGKGRDTLLGAGGNDTLLGGEDNDTLYGGVGNDSMDGGEGQNELDGEADDDTLRGGDENDTLLGGDGADILVGGDGIDSLAGGNHNDVLMGDDGADILRGGEGDDKLQGGAGTDKLYGDGGNDELYGGEGDQLYGGTGTDIYYVTKGQSTGVSDADSDSILIIQSASLPTASTARAVRQARNADAGAAIGLGWVDMPQPGEPDVYLQVGDTQVYFHSNGTRFGSIMLDDKVLISGEELAAFYKREIDDVLLLRGDEGDNVLVGDHRYNRLLGLGGNDTLQAGAGDDVLFGGSGDDLLQGEEGYDLLLGDAGNDTLEASSGDDSLLGGDGDDELKGGDGADTLRGDAGADTLLGGTGDDLLQGGEGDRLEGGYGEDTYEVAQGSTITLLDADIGSVVVITGAPALADGQTVPVLVKRAEEMVEGKPDIYLEVAGTRIYLESNAPFLAGIMLGDRVIMQGDALRDLLFTEISKIVMPVGDAGGNALVGTSGNNLLDALAGNDTLHGYGGDDVLKGGDGDDLLIGGLGNDILSGGEGNDIYRIGQDEGNDQLIDVDGRNRVIFGEGISADSVSFRFDDRRYSIVMDYAGGSLALGAEVKGTLEFAFADGTLKTFDELAGSFLTQLRTRRGTEQADWLVGTADKNLIEGGAGDDGLFSLEGDDTLAGGQGRDTMDGGEGLDTYRFGLGDGFDTVADADGNLLIELDASVDKATVRLERVSNKGSFDLLLKYGSDDVVVVRNGLLASQLTVRFADGSAWSLADIEATLGTQVNHQVNPFGNGVDYWTGTAAGEVMAADAGRDELYGRGGNDTLDGGSGNDLLAGEQGNDTYLVYSGMGRDQVIDSGANTIKLDAGLTGADVQFALRGDDLVVQLRQSTDSVVLRDFVKQKGAGWQLQFGEQDPVEMKAWVLAALAQQDKDDKISGNSQRLRQDFLARLLGEQEELATEGELDVQHDVDVRIQRVDVTSDTAEVSSTHERTEQTETTTVITPTRTDHILEQGREEIKVLRFIKHSDMPGPIDPNRYRPATRTEQVLVHPGSRHGLVDGPGQGQDGDGIDGLAPVYITQVVQGYEEITRITIPAKISTTVENNTEEKIRVVSTETKVGIMDVYGSAGNQSIFGSLGAISGGDGNDTLGGGWAWKTFVENHSKDMGLFLDGEAGNDVLVGTDGEDLLVASAGNDTLAGGGGGDTYSVQASSNYSLILDAGITPSFDYYNDLMKAGGGFGFDFYAGWADAIESGGSYSSRSLSGNEVASLYMGAVLTELMSGMVFTTYHPDDTEAEATYRTEEYSLITLSVRMLGKKLRFENIPTLAGHPSYSFNGDDGTAETEDIVTTSIAPLYELAQAGLLNVAMTSAEAFNRLSRQVLGLDGEYAKDILRFEGNVRLSDLTASMGSIMLHDKSYKTVRIQQADGEITEVVLPNPDTPAGFGIELLQFSDGSRATIGQLMQLHNLLDESKENQAPLPVGEINAPTASVDSLFSWTLPAGLFSDPDGDKLKIAVSLADGSPLPAWLSFDVETGTLSGTPAAAHQGSLALRLTATDAGGLEAKAEFALNVMPINRAPLVAGAVTEQTATADTPFALPLLAGLFSDPDGDVLSHAVTLADGSPLPAWLSFDAVTGVLSGTPGNAQAGELALLVVATDTAGLRATVPFSLQVLAVNHAPVVAGKVDAQVLMVGKPYSLQLPQDLFTDADAEDSLNVTFKLADGGDLPAWLVYDAASRTLAGTPMGQPGSLQLLVIASDSHGAKVQMPLEMTIAANPYMQLGAGAADNLAGSAQDDSLFGLAGNDTLNGAAGVDALVGGAGNDSLLGGAGKDTYLFGLGDGLDVVNEHYNASGDSFVFGGGIAQADIVLQRGSGAAANDLVIKYSAQDAITLQSFFTNATWYDPLKLETLRFADGSSITLQGLLQKQGLVGSAVADDLSVASVVTTEGFALYGLAGNDTLTGSQGADSLDGGLGNDSLVDGLGNDTLAGGAGNDTLKGDAGSNSYLFTLGDGQDVVAEQYNSAVDSLIFGTGIALADIVLRRGSGAAVNDLVVHYSAADAFTLPSFFTNIAWFDGLKGETLQFADGSSASLMQILAQAGLLGTADANDLNILNVATNDGVTLHGLGGNDTLTGSLGADTLVGGTGNDMLKGGAGSNSYVFNLGDGADVISEHYNSAVDTVIFGSGIAQADIVLQRGSGTAANDLVIKYGAQDAITLQGYFTNVTWYDPLKLETLRFADGSIITLQDLLQKQGLVGSAVADDLSVVSAVTTDGFALYGLAGNDTLTGSLGADTLVGGLGNDSLVGGLGNDSLAGGVGNDTLKGDAGTNSYVFNLGDGVDVISEQYNSAVDTVIFGSGIVPADVVLQRGTGANENDLVIKYSATDAITLQGVFSNVIWFDGLKGQVFRFDDGTSLTLKQALALAGLAGSAGADSISIVSAATTDGMTLHGLAGNDTLTGSLGADTLAGGAGNDSLVGGQGSNAYVFNLGDGHDVVNEHYASAADTLQFGQGIALSGLSLRQGVSGGSPNNDLVIQYGANESVTLLSMLTNAPWYDGLKQQTLKFADGTSVTLQTLMSQQGLMGSAGNDTMSVAATGTQDGLRLNGLEGADTLTGGLGADTLMGGTGSDSLSGGAGADVLAGGTGDDILIGAGGSDVYQVALGGGKDAIRENDAVAGNSDTLQFLDVASTAITSVQKVGQNLVFQYGNGDQVTIEGQYYSVDPTRFRVELFSFSDNVTWTDAQVQAKLAPVAGLSVNALLRPQEQVVHSGLDLDGVPPPSANLNQRLGHRANQELGPLAAGLSLATERNPEEQVRRNVLDLDGVPPPSANLNKRVGYTLSPYLNRPVAGLSVDMSLRPHEQVVRAGLDLDGVPPPSASLNNRTGHTADQQLNLLVDAMASFAPSAMGNLGAVAQDADMYRPVLAPSHH